MGRTGLKPELKVCILGSGVMGHSIGQVFAKEGYIVTIRDIENKYLQNAKNEIERRINREVSRERLDENEAKKVLGRISYILDLDKAIKKAYLIIEAIPENLDLKKKVLSEVGEKTGKDVIIASNTSSLSINKIAEAIKWPQRFLGMHFFNPPTHMKLIEVIPGQKTNTTIVDKVLNISKSIGKTPIITRDAPGFIVNRVLITYVNEAAKQLDNGYNIWQVDSSMKYNAGMPLGPFQLMDLIGIDIVYHILKTFEEKIGDLYKPHKTIIQLYNSGKYGSKTGEGYYNYEKHVELDENIKDQYDHTILLQVLIKEAEKVVIEGIADKDSVDTAMKLGANLPKGPFQIKEELYG